GHLGGPQAPLDLVRGDRWRQDRARAARRSARGRPAGRAGRRRRPPRVARNLSSPSPPVPNPRPFAMPPGRRLVLGGSGGIAAYKAVEVCRRLVDAGSHVAPVLTRGALRFVGETTFSAL